MGVPSALGAGRRHNREHALNLKGYLLCSFCYYKYAIPISSRMFRQLNQMRVTEFVHSGQVSEGRFTGFSTLPTRSEL
jgi:hypothetical protein